MKKLTYFCMVYFLQYDIQANEFNTILYAHDI